MATLSLTVPNALVPDLVLAAESYLTARGISFEGLTQTQKGQLFVQELIRVEYIKFKRQQAQDNVTTSIQQAVTTGDSTISTAVNTATTAANGIVG